MLMKRRSVYEIFANNPTPFDNRLTTGWMFVYTTQPVFQLVVKPV